MVLSMLLDLLSMVIYSIRVYMIVYKYTYT
jgi:hypothetical protein